MAEVDLDPNFRYRQAAQNTFFTGMQLGGQIAERRQMMEMRRQQMEEQAANALIARDTANLQNQMTRAQLADQAQERRLMNEEFPLIDSYMKGVREYELNPEANQLPQKPSVRSLTYRAQIDQLDNRIKEITPAYEAMQVKKRIFENKMQMRLNELKEADRLSRESGIDITIPMENDPLGIGVTVDPVKKSMALKTTAANAASRSISGVGDLMGRSDSELAAMAGRTEDDIANARANGTLQQLLTDVGLGKGGLVPTVRERNAKMAVDAAKAFADSAGYEFDQAEADSMFAKMMQTGGLGNFPVEANKEFSARFGVLELVDRFEKKVAEWEKKHPGRKFEDNIGIIPSTSRDLKSYIEAETDPAKKEAIQILTTFAGIKNQQLRTTSGMTVTPQESSRLADQIGDKFDKNTLLKIRQFRSDSEAALRNELEAYTNYAIPDYYRFFMLSKPKEGEETVNIIDFLDARRKRREIPKQGQASQGAPASGSAKAPSSTPVRVTSQQEYDALPSGALFIDDTGSTWQKP